MGADKIHRNEPFTKTDFGVLEDSPYQDGEVLSTFGTTEQSVLADITVVSSAIRTDNIVFLPTRIEDCLPAFGLAIEVVGEGEYGVESSKVYHKNLYLWCSIIYTADIGYSFKKN